MSNKNQNIFSELENFEEKISRLEGKIYELELKIERLLQIERNHLIRVKNKEEVSDDFIYQGRPYQDLSPEKAWKLYSQKDFDFVLIDVSSKDYEPMAPIRGAIRMPWENFKELSLEIQNKTTPILFISEDGTTSLLACELMAKRGFFNCNNISGSNKFWKGNIVVKSKSA